MTHNVKIASRMVRNPAYRQAFERLDAALTENTRCNNAERINLARIALFGDAARELIQSELAEEAASPE